MALNTVRLRADLGDFYDFMQQAPNDPAQGRANYVDMMEKLITRFVKSGTAVGQIVTTGSATTQTATANLTIQ